MFNKSIPKFKIPEERVEYWRVIYKSSLSSNLTKAQFCLQNNIGQSTLYRWSQYFKKQDCISNKNSKLNSVISKPLNKKRQCNHKYNFTPVTITDGKTHDWVNSSINNDAVKSATQSYIELLFPNGVKLVFRN